MSGFCLIAFTCSLDGSRGSLGCLSPRHFTAMALDIPIKLENVALLMYKLDPGNGFACGLCKGSQIALQKYVICLFLGALLVLKQNLDRLLLISSVN